MTRPVTIELEAAKAIVNRVCPVAPPCEQCREILAALDALPTSQPPEAWGSEKELAEAVRPEITKLLTTNRHVELVARAVAKVVMERPLPSSGVSEERLVEAIEAAVADDASDEPDVPLIAAKVALKMLGGGGEPDYGAAYRAYKADDKRCSTEETANEIHERALTAAIDAALRRES